MPNSTPCWRTRVRARTPGHGTWRWWRLGGAAAAQDTRPGIGVLPFANGGSYGQDAENFDALEIGLQQMLMTELAQNPALRIVDRAQIKQLLSEQELGASGRVDANTAARIGKLVGAKYMVMGGFTDLYGDMRLDLRVVNVETSEIMRADKVNRKREELYRAVVDAAQQLTNGLKLPPLAKQAQAEREKRDIPADAVTYYTRGLLYAERGDTERA
jgi:TolB-like protein